eukprot:533095_1
MAISHSDVGNSADFMAKWLGKEYKHTDETNVTNTETAFDDIKNDYSSDCDQIPMPEKFDHKPLPNSSSKDIDNDNDNDDGVSIEFKSFYKRIKEIMYDVSEKTENNNQKEEILVTKNLPTTKFTLMYECKHCGKNNEKKSVIKSHTCKVKYVTKIHFYYQCGKCDMKECNKKRIMKHISEKHEEKNPQSSQ